MMKNTTKGNREEEMFALVKTCIASEISNKDFCTLNKISQANYYYWQKKYLESQQVEPDDFIPVKFPRRVAAITEIEICYPNGVCIKLPQGSDLSLIRSFISLL